MFCIRWVILFICLFPLSQRTMEITFHPVRQLSQLLIFCLILEEMVSLPLNRQIKDNSLKQKLRSKRQNDVGNQVMYNKLQLIFRIRNKSVSVDLKSIN